MAATVPTGGSSGPGSLDFLQMLAAVAVVAGLLKWGLPYMIQRFTSKHPTNALGDTIRVEETTTVGPNCLHVVTVRGRTFLIGASSQSLTCLADLTAEAVSLRSEPAFFDALDDAISGNKAVTLTDPIGPTESESDQARQALVRLRRLAG